MQAPALWNRESRCSCPAEKRIVLIGASVRAAAQSAVRAGFCVTGIDLFGDQDTQTACHQHFVIPNLCGADSSEPESVAAQRACWEPIVQACQGIPMVTVGGLNMLCQQLEKLCPLLHPTARVRSQLDDPGFLRELAAKAGMRFPRTLDQRSLQTVTPCRGRWLIKKRGSCGGLGIRWHRLGQMTAADEFLQQWVAGRSYGATMLASGEDVTLLGVCRSLFSRHLGSPFVYAGSFGPITVSAETASTLERLGQQVVASTTLRGLFNVDFLLDRKGDAWLLEINPRWSGSSELVERRLIDQHALGAKNSLFELSIQAKGASEISSALGKKSVESARPQPAYLKRIILARSDVRFHQGVATRLAGLASLRQTSVHDIPVDGTVIRNAEPMLTLISRVEPDEKNPMRKHRVLLRDIHGVVERKPASGYSPRSSAYE